MNNLDTINIIPILHQVTDATGRQFYGLEADFTLSYVAQLGVKQNYKYLLEYQLLGKNPQYKINYTVNPIDLMNYQVAYSARGKRWVPLFSSGIFAPVSMMIHELIDLQTDVDFPVYFKAEGGMFKEVKITLGNRFIIRQYSLRSEIAKLVKTKNISLFEEATEKEVTYGDKIDPVKLVFEYQNKKYKVSNEYIAHLNAENVTFKNEKPKEIQTRFETFEELTSGMVPLTTSNFFKTNQ